MITPGEGEEVVIDTTDSEPVRGDTDVADVSVSVTADGAIEAADGPAIHGQGAGWSVENDGSLKVTGGAAASSTIHLSGGTVSNGEDGTIQWTSDEAFSLATDGETQTFSSIVIDSWTANAVNAGTIHLNAIGDLVAAASDTILEFTAVKLGAREAVEEDEPQLVFSNTGEIAATWSGDAAISGNSNAVRITGISMDGAERLNNTGTVEATFDGSVSQITPDSSLTVIGIEVNDGGTIVNSGSGEIRATNVGDGVAIGIQARLVEEEPVPDPDPPEEGDEEEDEEAPRRTSITNNAAIIAEAGENGTAIGVNSEGRLTLVNRGTITAQGIAIAEDEEGEVTERAELAEAIGVRVSDGDADITNSGTISAEGGFAVYLEDGGVLRNHGTLIGDVFLGDGDATLVIVPDATFDGNVDGGGGTNTLELRDDGNVFAWGHGEYAGEFENFSKLLVNAGSDFSGLPGTIWRLENDQTFTDGTTITSGVLWTTDTLTSDITIGESGMFISSGSVIGNLNVSGGVLAGTLDEDDVFIAPEGDGVLHVDGDVQFEDGSYLQLIAGETSLQVTGNVTIGSQDPESEGGAAPELVLILGDMEWDETYDLLSGETVTGEFEGGASHFALLINYDPDAVTVTKGINREAIEQAGEISNQRGIARVLANLNPQSGSALQTAFREFAEQGNQQNFGLIAQSMSGEIIASGAAAHSTFNRNFRQTIINSAQYRPEGGVGRYLTRPPGAPEEEEEERERRFWTRGIGVWGDLERSDGDDEIDFRTTGAIIGFDKVRTSDSRAGFAVGYADTNVSHNRDDIDGSVLQAALYAHKEKNGFFYDGTIGYGFHDMSSSRRVLTSGEKVSADYNAHELFGSIQATMLLQEEGFLILPLAGLEASYFRQDSFKESGAWGLSGDAADMSSFRAFVGLRLVAEHITAANGSVIPEVRFRYSQELLDRDTSFSARFAGNPGAGSFRTTGAETRSNEFEMGVGLLVKPGSWKNTAIFFDYDLNLQQQQAVSAGFRYDF